MPLTASAPGAKTAEADNLLPGPLTGFGKDNSAPIISGVGAISRMATSKSHSRDILNC